MQLEVISVMLRSIRIVKDVMVQSLHQWDAFDRSEEIFRHDITELVVGNILDIIGCDVGNLPEGVITVQCQFAAIKDSFPFQICLSVHFTGFAVLIAYFSVTVCLLRLDCKSEAVFFF